MTRRGLALSKWAASSLSCAGLLIMAGAGAQAQSVIHVPADQTTVQAGINASNNGDTVLVAPGTYAENITFRGKAIQVTSSGGPSVTTINGGAHGPVVTFNSGETASAILSGFTLTMVCRMVLGAVEFLSPGRHLPSQEM